MKLVLSYIFRLISNNEGSVIVYTKPGYYVWEYTVTGYNTGVYKMDILENSQQLIPHTCCTMNGITIFYFNEILEYFLEVPIHKMYTGGKLCYWSNNKWTIIKCIVRFLSLHHRAIITSNHPERKLLRGEFFN